MRELECLPREVRNVILEGRQTLRELMMRNVRAEKPKMDADAVCDLISIFFSGLSIEKNLNLDQSLDHLKVSNFMRIASERLMRFCTPMHHWPGASSAVTSPTLAPLIAAAPRATASPILAVWSYPL
jgi:hypothetical protein